MGKKRNSSQKSNKPKTNSTTWILATIVVVLAIGAFTIFTTENTSAEEAALAFVGKGEPMVVQVHNPG